MQTRLNLGITLVAALASITSTQAQNLVTNPGFESGDFTGYTVSAQPFSFRVANNSNGYNPRSGSYFAYLLPDGTDSSLTQNVATQAGQNYVVSFYLASNGSVPNYSFASFGGTNFFPNTTTATNPSYQFYSFTATASGTSTPLTLFFHNGPYFEALDDISVTAAPEPSQFTTLGIGLLGVLAVVATRRRRAFVGDTASE